MAIERERMRFKRRIRTLLAAWLCVLAAAAVAAAQAPSSQPAVETVHQVEFSDLPLADAMRLLSRQTGLNLVASQEAGKAKVSLFLQDVPPRAAIDELCRANNLWYRQDEATGIVRIMTVSEFQRDLTSFRQEQTQVFAVLYPNAVSTATAIADLYGDRVQLALGEDEGADEGRDISERFSRFDQVDQRSQGIGIFSSGSTVTSTGSSGGGSVTSGVSTYTSSTAMRRNGNAAALDADALRPLTPKDAEALSKTGGELTTAQAQALLDNLHRKQANIYVRVIRRNNLIVVRTSDQSVMTEIGKLIERLDVPTPTVLLEVKVLSVQLGDDFTSVFDYQFSNGSGVAGMFATGDINPPPSDALKGSALKNASMTPGGTGVVSKDLIFQVVSDNFRFRMQLLEGKNRVTELATPLLLTANNEVSRLFVGEERPIVRNISSQSVVNNTSTTVSPNTTIEFRPVGTTLLITPNINADRTVTMRLLQENSTIIPNGASIPVVTSNGTITNQPVDVVAARTLSGTVVAKDNLMLAVGGLIDDSLNDTRSEVPVLGKIPVLGFFFRHQETSRTRNEMIIMIRPHVLNTPAESQAISKDLLKRLSIHPAASQPSLDMNTFQPRDVLRPDLPKTDCDAIFRFHSVKPADY